jgi:hypothetical protein
MAERPGDVRHELWIGGAPVRPAGDRSAILHPIADAIQAHDRELIELLFQVACYCGVPEGIAAERALAEVRAGERGA